MGLLALLLGALGLGPTAAEQAALLQARGDATAARAAADVILSKNSTDLSALFVAACATLEAGELDAASAYAARLEQLRPDSHATVLKLLIQRRRTRGGEPLREALIAAWKEAGGPDLGATPLLRETASWGPLLPRLDRGVRSRLTAGERFVFDTRGPANSPAYVRAAIRASADAEKTPLVVNLEVLAALTPYADIPGIDLPAAARAAIDVGRVVASGDADNGYLVLAAILASAPGRAPFHSDDLAGIERALRKPRFEYPRAQAFAQLRMLASRIDPQRGDLRAWSAALGAAVPLYRLWQRAEATKDPELRTRAGDALVSVSARFRDAGTTLESALSLALAQKGAELRCDPDGIAAARANRTRWFEWQRSTEAARKRMGNWPFAAAWREWTPAGEIAYMRRLTD